MTYLQRILRQSKYQVAAIRLLRPKGRNGSLADLFGKFSRMSASGGKADIERPTGGYKKTRHMAGLSVFLVAGARLSNYMQIEVEPFPLVG
jgi:hypothetical protein